MPAPPGYGACPLGGGLEDACPTGEKSEERGRRSDLPASGGSQ